jgi:hypothetical protein
MKTVCCVLMVIGCAGLVYGPSPSGIQRSIATDDLKRQGNEKVAVGSQERRAVADQNHSSNHSITTKRNSSHRVSHNLPRPEFGSTLNHYQAGSTNLRGAANVQSSQVAGKVLPVRPRTAARSNSPWLLNNVRHRSPNPAIVDGLANSNSKNTGAINGTRMHRKL